MEEGDPGFRGDARDHPEGAPDWGRSGAPETPFPSRSLLRSSPRAQGIRFPPLVASYHAFVHSA
ncbi:hypothetical protein Arub01_08900 [Actinomadura rubrobrunea]|uniref:Uncharacterized protein n=1 Tax=Actinomadura rubrobrunea TaxID=115335 RepID=A0A9W6PTD3_9ACTN|nr:hypothetical protein Arub01_08900 [Actinomadura rubrobrunea]